MIKKETIIIFNCDKYCNKFNSNYNDSINKFHWSFYQLNTNKIIVLEHIEYFEKDIKINEDFNFSYGNIKLKNGKEHIYKFGQDFYKWFDSLPTINESAEYSPPSNDEKEFVNKFYLKNIFKN